MENQKEIWKDVPNYEGYYQVSNLGRVKSVKRIVHRSDGKIQTFKEKILKLANDSHGYLIVNLCKVGNQKVKKVHKLVAMAFLGHNPNGFNEIVDHIDNNQFNNRLDNLQLTTVRHNSSKDKKWGTSKYTGVSWYKRDEKWAAGIMINGKSKNLGTFDTELEAHQAYQNALNNIIKL